MLKSLSHFSLDKRTLQSAVEESMHLIVSTETELVVAKTTSSLQTKVIRTSAVPSASGTPDNTPDLKLLPGQGLGECVD